MAPGCFCYYRSQGKFKILTSVDVDLPSECADAILNDLVALRDNTEECGECLETYTKIWLGRLRSPHGHTRTCAREALQCQIASVPITSVSVEMVHILGEECRKPKSRGRALGPVELSKRSFIKVVGAANRRDSEAALRDELGSARRQVFGRMYRNNTLAKRGLQNRERQGKRISRQPRDTATNVSAWHEYRRTHWPADLRPCTVAAAAKQAELLAAFRLLPGDERAYFENMASVRSTSTRNVGESLSEVYDGGANDPGTRYRRQAARRRAFGRTARNISNNSKWKCGLGISGPWLPVREDLVDWRAPALQCHRGVADAFAFDGRPTPNGPGTHIPETCCHHKFGGMCGKDPLLRRVTSLTKNFHTVLRLNDCGGKSKLPLFISFLGPNGVLPSPYLLMDTYGVGLLAVCAKLRPIADGPPECFELEPNDAEVYTISTAHLVLRRKLLDVAASLGKPWIEVPKLQLAVHNFSDAGYRRLVLRRGLDKFRADLPADTMLTCPRRRPAAEERPADLPFAGDGLWINQFPADAVPLPLPDFMDVVSGSDAEDAVHGRDALASESASGTDADTPPSAPKAKPTAKAKQAPKPKPKAGPPPPPLPPDDVVLVAGGPPGVLEPAVGGGHLPAPGLESYGFVAGETTCFLCKNAIPRGDLKFVYRLRLSGAFRDSKTLHTFCVGELPMATRARDYAKCSSWLGDASLSVHNSMLVEAAGDMLRPYGAGVASGSGGAGAGAC